MTGVHGALGAEEPVELDGLSHADGLRRLLYAGRILVDRIGDRARLSLDLCVAGGTNERSGNIRSGVSVPQDTARGDLDALVVFDQVIRLFPGAKLSGSVQESGDVHLLANVLVGGVWAQLWVIMSEADGATAGRRWLGNNGVDQIWLSARGAWEPV